MSHHKCQQPQNRQSSDGSLFEEVWNQGSGGRHPWSYVPRRLSFMTAKQLYAGR